MLTHENPRKSQIDWHLHEKKHLYILDWVQMNVMFLECSTSPKGGSKKTVDHFSPRRGMSWTPHRVKGLWSLGMLQKWGTGKCQNRVKLPTRAHIKCKNYWCFTQEMFYPKGTSHRKKGFSLWLPYLSMEQQRIEEELPFCKPCRECSSCSSVCHV